MSTLKDYFLAGLQEVMDGMYPPSKEEIDERIATKMAQLKQAMQAKQSEKP